MGVLAFESDDEALVVGQLILASLSARRERSGRSVLPTKSPTEAGLYWRAIQSAFAARKTKPRETYADQPKRTEDHYRQFGG
jgi:hypothetical protein